MGTPRYAAVMASEGRSEATRESAETPEDDTKRQFREALERKKAKSAGVSDHKDGGKKQSRAHGPLESRREFRRKSG
ncbi:MAG: hypothetical protein JWQ31_2628 [Mycobacterium sp.]|nr:hypothetical protein [Mycobacterium sp.]